MRGNYAEFLLVLGLLYMGTTLGSDLNVHNSEVRCKPDEREALLKFSQGLLDSWKSEEDCCKLVEIECREQTGHVVKLNLSHTDLEGPIPQNLRNLSGLVSLAWLSNLSSLSYLDLSGVNLSQVVNWPGQVDMLPSLLELHLRGCGLSMPQISSAISRANFTSPLSTLDLSSNHLDSFVFHWLSKYTNLLVLDLSNNSLEGVIPELTQFPLLRELNLSNNQLNGSLTESIGKLSNLQVLKSAFRNNTPSLANLGFLGYLDLANNNLSGKIPTGTKLQGFNASVYAGNQDLCGLPLPTKCGDEPIQGPPSGGKHEDDANVQEHAISYDQIWLYSSIALGFIVGFWGVCGSLLLKSSWRRAYFQSWRILETDST
ncbi:Polygalacturonase inhibitor [Morella rubra]|uniref:Polygalacturonase inhibitor n=1 Tax=Morella rubra TaxID=262757 RepID=A0A6A1UX61_9ROSI|nr:Polygalacturonase inhibitor [Morella rubra]